MEDIVKHIKSDFNNKVSIKEKRPGVFQLLLPIYHEDGDMIDLFITSNENNKLVLCDYGLTLQRLSYTYDIDSENKEGILQRIISENSLLEQEGNISFETNPTTIYTDIMHITQAYSKIGSMRYFKREVIENLFYELLDEFVTSELQEFKPLSKVMPIQGRDDLEADYQFSPNGHPVYMFGVKDAFRARLAIISCLEYQKSNIKFRSLVVNEDFDKLPRKDRSRLTNTVDKQFTSLDEFKLKAREFLERERM
jgi:Domain of unknown function DUF1828